MPGAKRARFNQLAYYSAFQKGSARKHWSESNAIDRSVEMLVGLLATVLKAGALIFRSTPLSAATAGGYVVRISRELAINSGTSFVAFASTGNAHDMS